MVDNEKHYSAKMLRMRGDYQNDNRHFHAIKRCDYLVDGQNDHQLNFLCYGWVVSYGSRNLAQSDRVTVIW